MYVYRMMRACGCKCLGQMSLFVVANVFVAYGCKCLVQMSHSVDNGCNGSQSIAMVACKCLVQLLVVANVSWAVD